MRTTKLMIEDVSREFFNKFLEPFGEGYDAGKIINDYWHKYTLHEIMANLYLVLRKTEEYGREIPLYKADYNGFIDDTVSVVIAHYFYLLNDFDNEEVDIPVEKTFYGEVYPGRRGFIDEFTALIKFTDEDENTENQPEYENNTTTV